MIGGNIAATIQKKCVAGRNAIGERATTWTDLLTVTGWLDYAAGQNDKATFDAKVQDTTHYFFCDYRQLTCAVDSESCRMVIGGNIYEILLINDPMGMHQHYEIYLKYIGGGLGG